jgi:uncharacterized membrane protein (DUF106 family)
VKTLLYLILTIVGLVVIIYMLMTTLGLLIHVAIAAVVITVIIALIRYWYVSHQERKAPHRKHLRASKAAERALKDMERNVNKQ